MTKHAKKLVDKLYDPSEAGVFMFLCWIGGAGFGVIMGLFLGWVTFGNGL